MKKNKSNIFSKLTNAKSISESKIANEPKIESFNLIKFTPNEIIAEAVFLNGSSVIRDQFKILEQLNPKDIIKSINDFKNLELRTVNDYELNKALDNITKFNYVSTIVLSDDTTFYRARNKTFARNRVYDYFRSASEIWYPKPEHLTKLGRLNDIRQPIMYASFDALTPIHEIRSENDTQFALMKYKMKKEQKLRMTFIAVENPKSVLKRIEKTYSLPKKGKENWRLINEFLTQEFTKKVPFGCEYMYRSTNALLQSFDAPDCDGFIYPSIERGKGENLAIKPLSANRAVEFIGLAYWFNKSYDRKKINYADFYCHQTWYRYIRKDKIIYEPIGPCQIVFKGLGRISLTDASYDLYDVED